MLNEITALRKLLIEYLVELNFSLDESTDAINTSEIRIKGNFVTVIYDNGESDVFEISKVESYELTHLEHNNTHV